ncbi:MAG: hypothetical protein Q8Q01_04275 [archaeon]|nr:hypothetical protein [archaeon]
MAYRIVTHANCTDGFSSAFVIKKYFNILLGKDLSQKEIDSIQIVGVMPPDIQTGSFKTTVDDIVVDLPNPVTKVLFWCDHHDTSKPKSELSENYYWKPTPSCTGYLLELVEEKGGKLSKETFDFKRAIDTMDSASYSPEQIRLCYYKQENYDSTNPLLQLHIIGSMFNTRDRVLNDEIFKTLLSGKLGETPLSDENLWKLNPLMFHKAQLESYAQWRDVVDPYLEYKEDIKVVVQDDRKATISRGVADRFYVYIKFPNAKYSVNLRLIDNETTRFGVGSNIFHKDWCDVNIGKICFETGKKFEGAGGGHPAVGGVNVKSKHTDEALQYILNGLK